MVSPATYLIVISFVSLAAAQCSKPPIIFNFGDSNGSSALFGGPFVYLDGRTYFNRPTGRLCDGRLVADFLCESLHPKFLTPFMEPVERNFSNGVNFALSGSFLGKQMDNPKTLGVQIVDFNHFYDRSMELSGRSDLHLLGEDDFHNALYTIDIGQNDLTNAFKHRTYDGVVALIPYFMSRIRDAMQAIYLEARREEVLGARNWPFGMFA